MLRYYSDRMRGLFRPAAQVPDITSSTTVTPTVPVLNEFKSDQDPVHPDNTPLHDAIIDNDHAKAMSLISENKNNPGFLNKESHDNTALMLALKCGNIKVVKKLLEDAWVKVDTRDCRGLTPLHWACMLRQDEVISLLISKGADPHLETEKWGNSNATLDLPDLAPALTPINLYLEQVEWLNFYDFYMASFINRSRTVPTIPNLWRYEAVESRSENYTSFIDAKGLYIPGAMAYTDLIFHMSRLCENLGWKSESTTFSPASRGFSANVKLYRNNFIEGAGHFCRYRNTIPINESILQLMQEKAHTPQPETLVSQKFF